MNEQSFVKMDNEINEGVQAEHPEDTELYYTKERLSYLNWVKGFGSFTFLLCIAQIILAAFHLLLDSSRFIVLLVGAGAVFAVGIIVSIVWAFKATRTYEGSRELFQPRTNNTFTRFVLYMSLILAGFAISMLVNIYMHEDYSSDYIDGQASDEIKWNKKYSGKTVEGIDLYFKIDFDAQLYLFGFFLFHFVLVARAAFRCLKWENKAMSYLIFLGNVLLITFALGLTYYAQRSISYSEYPQIHKHFPLWNIYGLEYIGYILVGASFLGFFVDHKSWRIGFFVFSAILLTILVFLATFTGYAYRHTRNTYEYYKGVPDINTCANRMDLVHYTEIEAFGCPAKYTPADQCTAAQRVQKWEDMTAPTEIENTTITLTNTTTTNTSDTSQESQNSTQEGPQGLVPVISETPVPSTNNSGNVSAPTVEDTSGELEEQSVNLNSSNTDNNSNTSTDSNTNTSTNTPENVTNATEQEENNQRTASSNTSTSTTTENNTTGRDITSRLLASSSEYCLNMKCCGLLGQMYSLHLLKLSNFALLTLLAIGFTFIGCFYFWYATWVDSARDKKKDFIWLGVMVVFVIIHVIVLFTVSKPYIKERLGVNGRHIEMIEFD